METTDFSTKEDTVKANGTDLEAQIEILTADAIKTSFLTVAETIRAGAAQATATAKALAEEAEQLSQDLISAGTNYGDRVGSLLTKCREATIDMKAHRATLAVLPEISYSDSAPTPTSDAGMEAVSKSLE